MAERQLLEPILAGGVQHTNYFNGRLLGADDLRADQAAHRRQLAQLGAAMGAGVAYGLEVTVARQGSPELAPLLRVTPGLGLNRLGQALELPGEAGELIALVGQPGAQTDDAGLFHPCPEPVTAMLTGEGVYVFAITPASGFSGERTPGVGLDGNGRGTFCGSRYVLEGIAFKLISVSAERLGDSLDPLAGAAPNDLAARHLARSRLAARCLGLVELRAATTDLLARPVPPHDLDRMGLLASLRDAGLEDCDLPLAIFYWGERGVELLDRWAVRRRLAPFRGLNGWQLALHMPQASLREALLLQVQEQIDALEIASLQGLLDSGRSPSHYFSFLPPAFVVPPSFATAARFTLGGDRRGLPASEWRALLDASLRYEPLDLALGSGVETLVAFVKPGESTPSSYLFAVRSLADRFDVGGSLL